MRKTKDYPKQVIARRTGFLATGMQAIGALAVGALAVGAVALGALAIGRLAIGRARIRPPAPGSAGGRFSASPLSC